MLLPLRLNLKWYVDVKAKSFSNLTRIVKEGQKQQPLKGAKDLSFRNK